MLDYILGGGYNRNKIMQRDTKKIKVDKKYVFEARYPDDNKGYYLGLFEAESGIWIVPLLILCI